MNEIKKGELQIYDSGPIEHAATSCKGPKLYSDGDLNSKISSDVSDVGHSNTI